MVATRKIENMLTLDKYFAKFFSPRRYKQIKPELKDNNIITSLNNELFKSKTGAINR
jgi:hypothetical protein